MSLSVQFGLKVKTKGGIGALLVAGLMLVLWLGTIALAASPQLHQKLHNDSKSLTHECSATLLSKGHLLGEGSASFVLALLPVCFGLLLRLDFFHFLSLDYRLSFSRAPPGFSAIALVAG